MEKAYIVAYGRSAIGKGRPSGHYYYDKPENIASQVLNGVLKRVEGTFQPSEVDDLIVGCSVPENLQGMNIARKVGLLSDLGEDVPAQTINRFCASGLQSIATAAQAIQSGHSDIVVAGGLEFQSTTPPAESPEATGNWELEQSDTPLSTWMGLTAEKLADHYNISRREQDEFSVQSHYKAARAQASGRFEDEIIPVQVHRPNDKAADSEDRVGLEWVDKDQGIRPDTSLEAVSHLPTPFKRQGTVTAANASQISDGASFLVLMSESELKKRNITPIARYVGYQVTGVHPDWMGIGPVTAIPKVLKKACLSMDDMDVIELNEAFAAQALAVIKDLQLDLNRLNPNGGAIALGHPNGATGSVLTSRLLAEMKKRDHARYGMVSMCIGGGMGAAAIFEYVGGGSWSNL